MESSFSICLVNQRNVSEVTISRGKRRPASLEVAEKMVEQAGCDGLIRCTDLEETLHLRGTTRRLGLEMRGQMDQTKLKLNSNEHQVLPSQIDRLGCHSYSRNLSGYRPGSLIKKFPKSFFFSLCFKNKAKPNKSKASNLVYYKYSLSQKGIKYFCAIYGM